MPRKASKRETREVKVYTHGDKKRPNNPPAGLVTPDSDPGQDATRYEHNPTLGPQLVWAGKAEHTSFEVPVVSLHVHERIEPSTILRAVRKKGATVSTTLGFFDSPDQKLSPAKALEFYKHPQGWANRLIAGDSLLVMNSLLEKEAMAGKVQVVYFDPPYGIKYGSNFQPFVNQKSAKDGRDEDLSQEPEMVKAFRDTWELGLHSYLAYLQDRLLLSKQLLSDSGSCFVQIGDQNLHHVREIMDEVFGAENHLATIAFAKSTGQTAGGLASVVDYLVWYGKDRRKCKQFKVYEDRAPIENPNERYVCVETKNGEIIDLSLAQKAGQEPIPPGRILRLADTTSQTGTEKSRFAYKFKGKTFTPPGSRGWSTSREGLDRLAAKGLLYVVGNTLVWKNYRDTFPYREVRNVWMDLKPSGFGQVNIYVVQTATEVVARCLHLSSEPGDLVLDITCGSGTTAHVAELLGRRWITCDTSRVAITLAKGRLMTATYDYFQLKNPERGVGDGFEYELAKRHSLGTLANDEPPEVMALVDRPKVDKGRARITGPFTVEAVPSPVVKALDGSDEPVGIGQDLARSGATRKEAEWRDELLRTGIRGQKGQHLRFSRLEPFSGASFVHAVGEANDGKRIAVVFGPEFHPLPTNLVELAMKEARKLDPSPDMLVFAAFEFDPVAAETIDEMNPKVAGMTLARAKMNSDLLIGELKKKRSSNESFFFIGQPDVVLKQHKDGPNKGKWIVEVKGYDYFDVVKGELVSGDSRKIAMWMLDTDYDDRSLYPHQVFFPMRDENRDWTRLAKNLRAEINEALIEKYAGTVSIPFELGKNQKVAVKIVDDRGIESVKVLTP